MEVLKVSIDEISIGVFWVGSGGNKKEAGKAFDFHAKKVDERVFLERLSFWLSNRSEDLYLHSIL